MMASSSRHGARSVSPVEEDLQQLYNEVWAVFSEETPPASSDGDLENIYNGYTDDNDPVPTSSAASRSLHPPHQPSARAPSPYTPPVDTSSPAAPSPTATSPTRRRLPPTPVSVSSSATSPFAMPEPDPYYPPGASRPHHLYNSSSYSSFGSSGLVDQGRRATGSSSASSTGRRLPQAPGHDNGPTDDGERTPISAIDQQPHPHYHGSNPSFSSSSSFTSYTTNTSNTTDGYYRPPGALAPAVPPKPTIYRDYASDPAPYDAYGQDDRGVRNDYAHPPIPLYPAVVTKSDTPSRQATSSTTPTTPLLSTTEMINTQIRLNEGFPDFTLKNLSGSPSKNSFFDRNAPSSSSRVGRYDQPDAGPSRTDYNSPPQDEEEDNWDPNQYMYNEGREGYDNDYAQDRPSSVLRRPTDMLRSLADYSGEPLDVKQQPQNEYWEDEDEDDETRFVNFSLLSHIAMQLRDKVPRGTHVKGSIPYPRAFTGKDIVSTIQTQIQRELAINHGVSTNDRRVALQVARSLQNQLFFYEVEWGSRPLQDGVEDVYMFLDDQEGPSDSIQEREELPTGVVTMLTRCYSPSCGEGPPCYSFTCPRKGNHTFGSLPAQAETPTPTKVEEWTKTISPDVLKSLPETEVSRQTIIHKLISREEQYLQDIDIIENVFIKPLRSASPPIMPSQQLEDLIDDIFGNILDLRECNRRLLEVLYVRQREEGPIILRIGDIFLDAATEFRFAYPTYIGHYPISEKRLKDEMESNSAFRLFLEQCSREQISRSGDSPRLDLKHFLNRPSEHLQKYPLLLEAVQKETAPENPDAEFLVEATAAIKSLQSIAQLRTFQSAMGKGTPGKWEWHDIVSKELREGFSKKEAKRQSIIFELIKGEMAYVKDLENIMHIYIIPLRKADPPIISPDRLEQFIEEVFHNYSELYEHHKRLVDKFHEIQREQHPHINSVTAPMFDAALNFREAYMEYIPNYPIAAYRIDDEMANNLAFKTFVDQCVRHPDAHRLDMKNFINRPIPRLLRYELLLKGIMDETPPGHEDLDTIPNVIDVIKALGKETEPGVASAKSKVEVWRYNANLTFKPGESIDMDLLDPNRSLVHSGKLLRQPESGLEWNGWSELHVLLFDNYLVMTKPKEKDGVMKYVVNRRPIPLDLLTLVNFTDPPTQRSTGILRNLRRDERHDGASSNQTVSPESAADSRFVYPLTLHHNGRTGGPYILYAESGQIRNEWKEKLQEALGTRKVVQESNKAFEIEYLSRDTFIMPAVSMGSNGPSWNQDNQFTGKVTCSVPFNTPDGRALVAIGCTEGVWIGFRHDPKSIRRVLHLKMVTQCAMLEEFGIFLVLADKALFAYHIEALVPSTPHGAHTAQVPQKLSGTKDVHFFSVGTLQGRTLIVYMKKKGMDSIFRVLEPVGEKINERVKATVGFGSRLGFRSAKSEWFRVYRDFFLPSDSFDVIFLKARIAIFCAKGFEIMNLHDFDSITLPQREDPRHAQIVKRCENARPLGMFRSTDDEFLLCYDEFGLYVDKHGDPCRSAGTIEWEGTAERVAFHSPYILLFDSRFIEIRHIQTGRLAQIISGTEMRCTWDGRGGNSRVVNPDPADEFQEAQVHFVMNSMDNAPGTGGMRQRNIVQHVCELIPTVALYPTTGPTSAPAATTSYPPAQITPVAYNGGYAPAPTHAPTSSYASSVASSPHLYTSAQPPLPNMYSPAPAQPNPPSGGAYYGRGGYPSRSPDLQPTHSWRS
ncbi:hypothetical protein NLJ89_g2537 [Agrocybe chaxingu]|uniref:Rho1 guanine nucleotide exchange factor 1 n=1 Tax=Agrocybe chaxingu TaxID=84603 RepID=A0A9W8K7B4_9AGAR|nr:hypothetical protein NLJ89_g2537 [Agrocybe chaxingu]